MPAPNPTRHPSSSSTTPSTPRRHGPPSSLRHPRLAPRASNPHLSLVFAQSDAAGAHGGVPSRPGMLASEDALSRQLDSDSGGNALGLRSRRSSSATVRTMRTVHGGGSGSVAGSVVQEHEEEEATEAENQAGPSTLRREGEGGLGGEGSIRSGRTVNPKKSTSWLRWNSPAPSFPRSRAASIMADEPGIGGKGKGKERAVDATEEGGRSRTSGETARRGSTLVAEGGSLDEPSARLESHATLPPSDLLAPPSATPPDPPTPRPAPTPRRRGWWGRSNSPPPVPLPGTTQTTQTLIEPSVAATVDETSTPSALPNASTLDALQARPDPTTPHAPVLSAHDEGSAAEPPTEPETLSTVGTASRASGWRTYLWGGQEGSEATTPQPKMRSAPAPVSPSVGDVPDTEPPASSSKTGPSSPAVLAPVPVAVTSIGSPSVPTEQISSDGVLDSTLDSAVASPSDLAPVGKGAGAIHQSAPGWGGYLYSFVARPSSATPTGTKQESSNVPATDPVPTRASPSTDATMLPPSSAPKASNTTVAAKPRDVASPSNLIPSAPVPNLTVPSSAANATPTPAALAPARASPAGSTRSAHSATRTQTPAPTPVPVQPGSQTQGGWLSFLAARAAQRKLTASVAGHKSEEVGEVMDFSTDPDFPAAAEGVDAVVSGGAGLGKGLEDANLARKRSIAGLPGGSGTGNGHANPNGALSVRGKRLSVSSTRSGASGTGTAPAVAPLGTSVTTSPNPKSSASVKTPTVPAPPSRPPNLVIPSFSTTFDRPPRSLLPLSKPTAGAGGDSGAQAGAAQGPGYGSMAWRALSVAGSYVYPYPTAAMLAQGQSGKAGAEAGAGGGVGTKVGDAVKEKETRGLKEGRGVGADLPRRVGMLGEGEDAGWRGVKRVVVVGVHGWFPAKMLNSVIGEPTGTSAKFANMMGAAVRQFFADKGVDEGDIRLTLMPLEGEGTIEHRVDKLYKAYLSNPAWINDLRRADAIFFAAHSQGCIATTHLISRLIAQGHIRTPLNRDAVGRCEWAFGPVGVLPPEEPRRGARKGAIATSASAAASGARLDANGVPEHPGHEGGYQKVCLLSMCGVHLGPLLAINTSSVIAPYIQWFENAAARELFEFQESESAVSVEYTRALGMCLDNGVRTVLLASMNDQVVPIYGASFTTANHPLILRALFVDGATLGPGDFMTDLLAFAFMLRNAGLDDQRLVEHLSEATAGSLTGVGHSTPYEEPASYALAVQYLFHSAAPRAPVPSLTVEPFSARGDAGARNEYELPWIMRALVDSKEVRDLFPAEIQALREGVGRWRPVGRALREMKRRLEPMAGRQRSKLGNVQTSGSGTSINTMVMGDGAAEGSTGTGATAAGIAGAVAMPLNGASGSGVGGVGGQGTGRKREGEMRSRL